MALKITDGQEPDLKEMARSLIAVLISPMEDDMEDRIIDILTDENYSDADIAEFIQWIEY